MPHLTVFGLQVSVPGEGGLPGKLDEFLSKFAATQELLVSVKLGEEVDIGANFYYYPNGNEIVKQYPKDTSHDPKSGPDWSKGIAGGLQPQGYNVLRTLGIRSAGGPPTEAAMNFSERIIYIYTPP